MKKYYLVIPLLFLLGISPLSAQYTNLHNFNDTAGSFPTGNLTLAGGKLFGLTGTGGASGYGCIFTINTNGSGYKDIHDFAGYPTDGASPFGSLTLSGSQLYGMTWNGGTYSTTDGCIFSIDTDGNGYMIRFDFGGPLTVGFSPYSSLTLSDSVFYGMAAGGPLNAGLVFSIDTAGEGYDTVMTFNVANGANPHGFLTLAGEVLYGMTTGGGANNSGCIFSVNTNGAGYRDLHDFSTGSNPTGSLTLSGAVLYGMTEYGGTLNSGNIFSIDTDGTGYKDRFDFNDTLGAYPQGDLTVSGGVMYGMTSSGGANGQGDLFSIDTDGNGFTDLLDFNGTDGENPQGDLLLSGNVLYGMAYGGGEDSDGVIFKMDTNTPTAIIELSTDSWGVNLYPNPNEGQFTLTLNNPATMGAGQQIRIYDLLGEIVYQANLTSGDSQIRLPELAPAVYLYRIVTNDDELRGEGKFVIK